MMSGKDKVAADAHALQGVQGLLFRAIDSEADYRVREGKTVAGPLVSWNFGGSPCTTSSC